MYLMHIYNILVSFMSHDATSHDWLLDRFVGRLSRHISAHVLLLHTHTQQMINPRRKCQHKCLYIGMIGLLYAQ